MAEADAQAPREYTSTYEPSSYEYQAESPPQPAARQSDGNRAVALYAFEAESDAELSFPEGAEILVTNVVDENWLEGTYNNAHGIFPVTYVQYS